MLVITGKTGYQRLHVTEYVIAEAEWYPVLIVEERDDYHINHWKPHKVVVTKDIKDRFDRILREFDALQSELIKLQDEQFKV